MKSIRFTLLILASIIALNGFSKSEKRGVSENQFQFKAQLEAVAPGASWYYNWGSKVGRYLADETVLEFVPMCWNANYDAAAIREYVGAHPEVKYLLGFNEPNFTAQANMSPQVAAAAWGNVQALAKELGLKLVAPALNYSPNPPYTDPCKWMDEFVALVGNDAFDYTAVHSYGGFGVMKDLATKFHEKYGKPVWVTEFCYWPEEGNANSTVNPEAQISIMMQSLEWLEKTPWIYRYAWFKAIGESSADKGPNYGLILSGHGEDPRELSEQGKVYTNLWEYDVNKYFATEEWVSAACHISQYGCLLGSYTGTCSENDRAIEITRFNAGAYADWQFDVPADGSYILTLRVSGKGEPQRFDPTIAIYSVDSEGNTSETLSEARQFTLPGNDETYIDVNFALNLKAGKQTIRVADANASMPSGIHIAALKLSNAAAINTIAQDGSILVDVFSADGRCIRKNVNFENALDGCEAGVYIVGGMKILKH